MALPFCTEVKMRRPIGSVRIRVVERGGVVREYAGNNLFVNAGLPALAALLGGDTTGEFAAAVGFGTGSNAPTVNDNALTAPAYYKALDGHSEDGGAGNHDPGAGDFRQPCERGAARDDGADTDARAQDDCANRVQRGNEY